MKTALAATLVLLLAVTITAQRGRGGAPSQPTAPTPPGPPRVEELKKEAAAEVESMRVQTQQMVDQVFSFAELGFQEFETSKYLTDLLEKNGVKIERSYAGVPTAWFTTWGSGKPVIAIGRCRSSTRSRARAPTLPRNRGAAARRSTPSS